jgi:hypothetical protein
LITADPSVTLWLDVNPFLLAAIEEVERSFSAGGIPIVSVLANSGAIVGRGYNRRVQKGSAILHGEMDALENGRHHAATFYCTSTLYTTLSPCSMCSRAILLYSIPRGSELRPAGDFFGLCGCPLSLLTSGFSKKCGCAKGDGKRGKNNDYREVFSLL